MASTEAHVAPHAEKEGGIHHDSTTGSGFNGVPATNRRDYGSGNPLAHTHSGPDERLAAFGGEFQPGLYRSVENRKFANPAPLGLSAFALTTFVLSLINLQTRGVQANNIVVSVAFGYGGLVQLLSGMWEMAVGNTFGATALSSYGGFWISFAIILTPGFGAASAYEKEADLSSVLGFFLAGWFIFTTILFICTLRSTVMFCALFGTLDLAFLFLFSAEFAKANGSSLALGLQKAGGVFGLLAAFLAWYNAFAGIADSSNSFFLIPVFHFPWSEKARAAKTEREVV